MGLRKMVTRIVAAAILSTGLLLSPPLASAKGGSGSRGRSASAAPKSVHVRGYQKKNGTTVKPHTRSAPGSRSTKK